MDAKKILWAIPVGIVMALYSTFATQNLWNWFVVPAFHVSGISFWEMYGLVLVVGLLAGSGGKSEDEPRWTMVFNILDFCIPDEKMEDAKAMVEREKETIWVSLVSSVFGKVLGITTALVIGWFVHVFLA